MKATKMPVWRCVTCNWELVNKSHQPEHIGHSWVKTARLTICERGKILWWRLTGKL